MTLEEFKTLLRRHDRYYQYSDDSRVYNKGRDSWRAIQKGLKELGDEGRALYQQYVDGEL